MSLSTKYRPLKLEKVVGNEKIVNYLEGVFQPKEHPHVFLFYGPTGCGKTTFGRIIKKQLKCSNLDFKEVNMADLRGIETAREMIRNSQFKPVDGPVRIWLIDEAHKMTGDAQNAMLKILEEPPAHVYFILCTTDPQKLLTTVKGRCIQLQVTTLSDSEMYKVLSRIVKQEGKKIKDTEVYDQIIQDSFGLPRNAIQILEQVLSVSPKKQLESAKQSAEEFSQSIELCGALLKGDPWKKVGGILKGLKGQDAEGIRRHILGYAESVLLKGANDRAALMIEELFEPLFNIGFPGLVFACYSIVKG